LAPTHIVSIDIASCELSSDGHCCIPGDAPASDSPIEYSATLLQVPAREGLDCGVQAAKVGGAPKPECEGIFGGDYPEPLLFRGQCRLLLWVSQMP
jgi:hypothetical protein